MNIIEAIENPKLFRHYLSEDGDLTSWSHWTTMLRALYGLPISPLEDYGEIIRQNTGRDIEQLSSSGYEEALLLCGRRSGKSKIVGLVAAYEAILSGATERLSPGEVGLVAVVSPTRAQSRVVHTYVRACLSTTPVLCREIVKEERDRFILANGVEIAILTGDPRAVRGFTLIAAIIDEVCFFGLSDESKVRSDTELVRSLRPALGTTEGRMLCISTPYRAAGYGYETYSRHYANNESDVLVWTAPSTEMNPTLNPKVIERALEEDEVAASVEYVVRRGQFREDIDDFVARSVIESLVVPGRIELAPRKDVQYRAFCDVSGGMVDDAAICIAHQEGRKIIVDCLKRYPSPHRPQRVVAEMVADVLKRYDLNRIVGDWYSAGWVRSEFESHGIRYDRASRSTWKTGANAWHPEGVDKSRLYLELLPWLHSGGVELPDDPLLVSQLSSLQRSTRTNRDRIDHAPNAHDDLANSVAGAVYVASQRDIQAGAANPNHPSSRVGAMALSNTIDDREDLLNREYAEGQKHYDGPVDGTLQIGPQLPL